MNTNWSIAEWTKAVACSLVLGGSGAYFALICSGEKTVPRLDEYGCVIGQPVAAHTLIIADLTDPYSTPQIQCFHDQVERILSSSPAWGMVSIATIGKLPPRFIAIRCSPPHVSAATDMWNHPNESWVQINARYYNSFYKPLHDLENAMPFNQSQPYSPIFQTIDQATRHLGSHWSQARERHLVIYSDMMENTKEYSQYSGSIGFDFNIVKMKVAYLSHDLNLRNTSVVIYYLTGLPGDRLYQGDLHRKFWQDIFQAQGATVQFIDLPTDGQLNPLNQETYVQSN